MTPPVIELRDLTMRFGQRLVHEGISLDIHQGEILAIVGASGSGKSTLLREMLMLQEPSAGSIRVLGSEITRASRAELLQLRRRSGVLFQNSALFSGMDVLANVGAPLREHTRLDERVIDDIARLKLSLTGLRPEDGRLMPNQLSGGMRKRAALARAIALDPELLFLDEPTSGLDPLSADGFDRLILDLKASLGPTIILVTHDMDSLWQVADRVILLGEARVIADGTMAQLARSTEPAVMRFFQGPRGRAAQASA